MPLENRKASEALALDSPIRVTPKTRRETRPTLYFENFAI